MEVLFIISIIVFVLGFGVIIYFLSGKTSGEGLSMLQNQINEIAKTLDRKLSESNKMLQEQFGQSSKIIQEVSRQSQQTIKEVTERLTQLDDTNKQIMGFADQMQSLENILKNPKQRGVLGEYYLEELLKNVFNPNQYQMQYEFKNGEIVDAVIFIKDKIIPIDSKFSLENYNKIIEEQDPSKREQFEKIFKQDLKNRIDETAKYIRPRERTLDFAFMFIPAEAIYYDLLVNKVGAVKANTRDLINYAVREKHVHIVSPTSFYAYLQTILQGLRAMQIEESAQEIRKGVEQLARHLLSYEEYMRKLGNNLSTTVNMYNSAYKEFGKIDKDIVKITGGKKGVEPLQIEKPAQE